MSREGEPRVASLGAVGVAVLGLVLLACDPTPPDLPASFAADTVDRALEADFGVTDIWQIQHPDYAPPLKVLVAQHEHRSFRDYTIAFFRLDGDTYARIDMPLVIGGYDRPVLGAHPELGLPAVVAKITGVEEVSYIFVRDGSVETLSSDEEAWIDVDEDPGIEKLKQLRQSLAE